MTDQTFEEMKAEHEAEFIAACRTGFLQIQQHIAEVGESKVLGLVFAVAYVGNQGDEYPLPELVGTLYDARCKAVVAGDKDAVWALLRDIVYQAKGADEADEKAVRQ